MEEKESNNSELISLVNHIKEASEKIDFLHDISEFKVGDRVLVRVHSNSVEALGREYLIGYVEEVNPPVYIKVNVKAEDNDGTYCDEPKWINIIDLIPNNPVTISLDFNDDGENSQGD